MGGVTKWVSQVLPMEFQKYSAIAELGTGEFLYLNEQKKLCSILDDDLQAKADRTLKAIQLTGFAAPQCHEPGRTLFF